MLVGHPVMRSCAYLTVFVAAFATITPVNARQTIQPVTQISPTSGTNGVIATTSSRSRDIAAEPFDCNFDNDFCSWKQETTDKFDWQRQARQNFSTTSGPTADVSGGMYKCCLKSKAGYFAFINSSAPRQQNDNAILNSPSLSGQQCVTFSYFMWGEHIQTLNVYAGPNKRTLLWTRRETQGKLWLQANININISFSFQIQIEAIVGRGSRGDIAIDEISAVQGICSELNIGIPGVSCDFEQGLCDYKEDTTDNFDWIRNSGATTSPKTGILQDHTYGTLYGHYMYIDTSNQSQGDIARLYVGPVNNSVSDSCLEFWYHMFGSGEGELNVALWEIGTTGSGSLKWNKWGNQGQNWYRGTFDIPNNLQNIGIVFEAVRGSNYTGYTAIDDIVLKNGKCAIAKGNCNFELDLCSWSNSENDDMEWISGNGKTISGNTGPENDHTLGNITGTYLYIETSSPSNVGDSAVLVSEFLPPVDSVCFHFFYNMYGATIGTLRIWLVIYDSDSDTLQEQSRQILWELSGNQSNIWHDGVILINRQLSDYKILIEGIKGSSYTGDIAIDDITFNFGDNSPCVFTPGDAVPTTTITTTSPALSTAQISALDCSFTGGDLCGFYQSHTDDFDWSFGTGPTPSNYTGPASDHTTGTGSYIYIETSSPQKPGDKAMIISAMMPPTGEDMCIKFWYHMFGPHIETLNVYLFNGLNNTRIWTRSTSQGNTWRQGEAPVSSSKIWQIGFEGVVGSSYSGDIALDDISISREKCPPQVMCDFEIDQCGYTQPMTETFRWTRSSSVVNSFGTRPSRDHTTRNGNGFYMLMDASTAASGESARLMSPQITATYSRSYCVYFWYHMIGEDIGQLNVYASSDIYGDKLIWSNNQPRGDYWTQGRAFIDSNLGDCSIKFEGQIWRGFEGDMALDDIRVVEGVCPHDGSCDFEYDMCGFFNPNDIDAFNWLRNSGETSLSKTGPPVDHTTNTDEGFYIYTEAYNQQAGDRAWLYSDFIPFTDDSCLEFWFYMNGQDVGTLRVYLVQVNNISNVLWQLSGSQGNLWKFAKFNYSSHVEYQIVFDGEIGAGIKGDIAVDDVLITDGGCVNTTGPSPTDVTAIVTVIKAPSPSDCNFDNNTLCTWAQDTSGTVNWSLQKGATNIYDTGPSSDHTTGFGYYIYSNSSHPYQNDTARIISTPIEVDKYGVCFKFWYNMYGSEIGTLNVYAKQGEILGTPIWTRIGDQSQKWLSGYVFMSPDTDMDIQVQMVFEAVLIVGFKAGIALDDLSVTSETCVESGGSCDFETFNYCGFTQDTTDDFDWTHISTSTMYKGIGPRTDHTFGTNIGFYMYTTSSSTGSLGDKARLISPTLKATDGRCLHFFYYMQVQKMWTLNVYQMLANQLRTPIWTISGEQLDKWLPAQVTLISPLDFQVVFESVLGGTDGSYIALDDVSFVSGPCPTPATCDFESGSCLFTNSDGDDDFDWDIYQGNSSLYGGPSQDHTLQSLLGHYMLADTHDKSKGDRTRLFSEVLHPTIASCLTFFVAMPRVSTGSVLSVRINTDLTRNGHFDNKLSLYNPQNTSWLPELIDIQSTDPYLIVFEVQVGTSGISDIAIDDVMLSPGKCPQKLDRFDCGNGQSISTNQTCDYHQDCTNNADEAFCGNCTFETDLCGFLDVSKGSIAWKQATDAEADDVGTRIGADHTLKTIYGHFMYVTQQKGDTYSSNAVLISPELKATFESCQFQFYYKRSAGALQVFIQVGSREVLIWETRNQVTGTAWARALVNIGHYSSPIKVLIQATRSYSTSTTVAIDDTRFLNCGRPPTSATCQSNQLQCANRICYNRIFECDLTDDCGDGSDESDCKSATQCNFETGLCTWTQDTTDDLDWTLNSGKTSTPNTGPNVDHSTGLDTGHYIYLETSSPAAAGQKARLLSPVISPAQVSDDCHLSFFYHMYGDSMGPLNIYIATEKGGYPTLLFTRQMYDQNYWAREVLPLNNTKNFVIIFEGVVGRSIHGDMAIDDVSISAGCKLVGTGTTLPAPGYTVTTQSTTTNKCSVSQFQCSTGECIDSSKVCDFVSDCRDGSEENMCGTCTFENGMCGWSYASTGKFKWSLSSKAIMGIAGPATDTKPGNSTGHYIYIEPDFGLTSGPSVLRSSPLGAISTACEMKFSYHNTWGSLSVYVPIDGVRSKIWSSSAISNVIWKKAFVNLGRNLKTIQLPQGTQIEITYDAEGSSTITDFASIDEISFVSCNPKQTSPDLACNFEKQNLCNWLQSSSDKFDWILQNGSTPTADTGPSSAHGGLEYIYAKSSYPRKANDTADLISSQLSPTAMAGYCLSFWYHMHGSSMGSLQLIARYLTDNSILWFQSSIQINAWIPQNIFINISQDYTLIFQATVGSGDLGAIALDDITTSLGTCPALLFCTFDNFCEFTQETNDTFDWSLGSGSVKSNGSRPSTDHTFGSSDGKYAYIEASGRKLNDNAIITSSIYNEPYIKQGCLTFWYYMFGAGMGTLNVYRRDQVKNTVFKLWSLQGSQENMWKRALVNVTAQNKPYQIQFEGIVGTSFASDIAIDDLEMNLGVCSTVGPCDNNQFVCAGSGDCINQKNVCDFHRDCTDGSDESKCDTSILCNFNNDLCTWREANADKLDWEQGLAVSMSSDKGPNIDGDSSDGGYIYIDDRNNGNTIGQSAVLQSQEYGSSSSGCILQFAYYIAGSGAGTLSLQIFTLGTPGQILWQTSQPTTRWVNAAVGIGRRKASFNLTFSRAAAPSFSGQIALDNFYFVHCTEPQPAQGSCSANQFHCATGACIANSLICNKDDDCGDGSDEQDPSCSTFTYFDFETSFGNFSQSAEGQLNWQRWDQTQPIASGLQEVDHSTGLNIGHYIFVSGGANTGPNDQAWLLSQVFDASDSCTIRFFAMIPTTNQKIEVSIRSHSNGPPDKILDMADLVPGTIWQQMVVSVIITEPFQLMIRAQPGGPNGAVAVDDIILSSGCKCASSYHGATCSYALNETEQTASTIPELTSTSSSNPDTQKAAEGSSDGAWKIPVGVVLGLLGVVGVAAGIFIFLKKTNRLDIPFQQLKRENNEDNYGGLTNPVFGYSSFGGLSQDVEPTALEEVHQTSHSAK